MLQQRIPASGIAREALRAKGQFWTPDWVADAMVSYVAAGGAESIFDPAVGAGAFFRAAKRLSYKTGRDFDLHGTEIDPSALDAAHQSGLRQPELKNVQIRDFVLSPPQGRFKAIVANPPYIRHHRLSGEVKAQLRQLGTSVIGHPLDGRAGLHVYFLIRALQLLDEGGRLAFIVPADICEGVFAPSLWDWIVGKYRLEAVVTFAPEATPFPGVDTNPIIILIQNAPSSETFWWAKCWKPQTSDLSAWIESRFQEHQTEGLLAHRRQLTEAMSTGLTRPPYERQSSYFTLGDYASVLRGIATGANDFFFLTRQHTTALQIPNEFLIPALGRTRDVDGDEVTSDLLERLDNKGRPTLLFSPDGRAVEDFPSPVQAYLQQGEQQGIHKKALIATRKPWYKMESRSTPPILFAYLGRRNARFIRNRAGVVPLTGFLCVYPRHNDLVFEEKLWQVLRHPVTLANLAWVGKSYGGGAIKVEPRSLEMLPLPTSVLHEMNLEMPQPYKQLRFFERRNPLDEYNKEPECPP